MASKNTVAYWRKCAEKLDEELVLTRLALVRSDDSRKQLIEKYQEKFGRVSDTNAKQAADVAEARGVARSMAVFAATFLRWKLEEPGLGVSDGPK